jgi:hypothetical protein
LGTPMCIVEAALLERGSGDCTVRRRSTPQPASWRRILTQPQRPDGDKPRDRFRRR